MKERFSRVHETLWELMKDRSSKELLGIQVINNKYGFLVLDKCN